MKNEVKETVSDAICTSCVHRDVCMYKNKMLDTIVVLDLALNNSSVSGFTHYNLECRYRIYDHPINIVGSVGVR